MWQFTASLNWSVSSTGARDLRNLDQCSLPLPSSTLFPTLHPSWPSEDICSYHQISIHYRSSVTHCLSPHLCTLHTMPISGRTICPVCYCCYSLHSSSPLLSSLANKASDPRLSEAAPAPGLFTEAVPVSPRSLAIFQDLSPVTSYTCKYNGLGDYWAINNNARKAQKGVDLCFFSLSPKWLISNLCSV